MAKGRPTAEFTIRNQVDGDSLTITITADITAGDYADSVEYFYANGTVELGKVVAELGKTATPLTAADRKRADNVALLTAMGLTKDAAEKAAALLK